MNVKNCAQKLLYIQKHIRHGMLIMLKALNLTLNMEEIKMKKQILIITSMLLATSIIHTSRPTVGKSLTPPM